MGLFTRKKKSSNTAKDRLKLVLIHDRANTNTEVIEMMKAEIIQVINKYMIIDEEGLEINMGTTDSDQNGVVPMLSANIPIKNMRAPKR